MNLVPFALFSQKIPSEFLNSTKKKSHTYKNILSLIIDYSVVSIITSLITIMMTHFINLYLTTFSSKFIMSYPQAMGFIVFPLALFAYYTICLHACDGMTLGTRQSKRRITEGDNLKIAFQFTLTICTFGATYFLIKNYFTEKDYRYENLMMERSERVDLHALIKTQEHEDQFEEVLAA